MESVSINFLYESESVMIQCTRDEYMKSAFQKFLIKLNKDIKNIYYLYNGTTINPESKLKEINNKDNEINLIVVSEEEKEQGELKYSKDIICPTCGENCILNFKDYKIQLIQCENNHEMDDILITEFEDTQKIDESSIICNDCQNVNKLNSHENKFYKCCTCQKNICPLCKNKNHNQHIIIDYDYKSYFCNTHGEKYNYYCEKCNKNLCDLCEHDKDHHLTQLKSLMKNKNEILETNEKLKNNIDILTKEINEIIGKLNKIKNDLELYYKITNNAINNYDIKNKSFQTLTNIININQNNKYLLETIERINNNKYFEDKMKYINEIYKSFITKKYKNEIIVEYKVDSKEEEIKLFSHSFAYNNRYNYEMIVNNKKESLKQYLNIRYLHIIDNKIQIKLKEEGEVTDLRNMFKDCTSLLSLKDISKFNINNVTSLVGIFDGCSSLSSLPDLSKWNTENVTDISSMFDGCSALSSLPDISNWNTKNIKNMKELFQECSSLSSLPDISKWNIENVTDISWIFNKCSSLESLPDISKWNTGNIIDLTCIFQYCSSLKSLPDLSEWKTVNVKDISGLFSECTSLNSLPDISRWNTDNVEDMKYLFYHCSSLESIPDI